MKENTTSNQAASPPVQPAVVASPAKPNGGADPNLHLNDGAEAGVGRFCEETFITPEATRVGAAALLNAFDNSGLWLSSLVQPAHLVCELRQSCSILTRVIVTQWTRQGETHKLSRLGAILLEANPPIKTHAAGQIMALLASLLGILRPARSQSLLESSRSLLQDSTDSQLLREANEWVAIGSILEELPAEDRIFWNRRLRDPEEDLDWTTVESREALKRLAPLMLALEDEDLSRFQQTVPGCWWDAIHLPRTSNYTAASFPVDPRIKFGALFAGGLLLGVTIMAFTGTRHIDHTTSNSPLTASGTAVASTPALLAEQAAKHPQAAARQTALAKLVQEHANVQRLHNVVKSGSLRENEALIYGRSSMAYASSPDYRALITWLMLDPPDNTEVRLAVAKIATRALQTNELVSLLKMCVYPGSPNDAEARECATWALELIGDNMTEAQKRELTALRPAMAKS